MRTETSYRNIIRISLPILLGLVAQNIINVTDTVFLGHVNETALGAGAMGGLFYFAFIIIGAGLGIGVQITIGRRNGENNVKGISNTFSNGLYLALTLSAIFFFLLYFYADTFLAAIIRSKDILSETFNYIHFRQWGIIFAYINIIIRAFYVGTLRTNILIYSTLFMSGVNIFLDYCLIFGNFGLPEMGVGGAALASVFAEMADFLFLASWTIISKYSRKYKLFYFRKSVFKEVLQLLKLSYPIMIQYAGSFGSWFVFFLIIEKIGSTELAISNIIRSYYMVIMIPVWGLSSATNTLVSNLIGNNQTNQVTTLIKKLIILSFSSTLVIILSYVFIPEIVLSIYSHDLQFIEASVPVLYAVTVSLVFFSVSNIIFSAVSGTGNTLFALFIEGFTLVFYISGVYITGIVYKLPLYAVWSVEAVYFIILGLLSYIYFKKYNWKNVKI